jgi:hypothetical protein
MKADRGVPRLWYIDHFVKHPGYDSRVPAAFTGTGNTRAKVKVWCRLCLDHRVAEAIKSDENQVKLGQCTTVRTKDAILEGRKFTLLAVFTVTLTHCEFQCGLYFHALAGG